MTSELPGVAIDDLDITVSGKLLTVKGQRKMAVDDEKIARVRRERPEGAFERTFQLPFTIEAGKVEAKFANGVLEVALPRAENDKPRKVLVNGK